MPHIAQKHAMAIPAVDMHEYRLREHQVGNVAIGLRHGEVTNLKACPPEIIVTGAGKSKLLGAAVRSGDLGLGQQDVQVDEVVAASHAALVDTRWAERQRRLIDERMVWMQGRALQQDAPLVQLEGSIPQRHSVVATQLN